jgi:uncharacterized membrane protein
MDAEVDSRSRKKTEVEVSISGPRLELSLLQVVGAFTPKHTENANKKSLTFDAMTVRFVVKVLIAGKLAHNSPSSLLKCSAENLPELGPSSAANNHEARHCAEQRSRTLVRQK